MDLLTAINTTLPQLMGHLDQPCAASCENIPDLAQCVFVTDTRQMQNRSGDHDRDFVIFVPLVGPHYDGHDFIDQALAQGAKGCLYQLHHPHCRILDAHHADILAIGVPDTLKAYQAVAWAYRAHVLTQTQVIALSGSCGKTTLKSYLVDMLRAYGQVASTQDNQNNAIGVSHTLLATSADTDYLVCEMGMRHKTDLIELVHMADPHICVLSCVEKTHLSCVQSLDEIYEGKLELFFQTQSPPTYWVAPGSDAVITAQIEEHRHSQAVEVGYFFDQHEDDLKEAECGGDRIKVVSKSVDYPHGQTHVTMSCGDQIRIQMAVDSIHCFAAKILSAAVCVVWRLLGHEIVRLHGSVIRAAVSGRFSLIQHPHHPHFWIIDDAYNASPASMKAGLDSLHDFVTALRVDSCTIIVGDMLELGEQQVHLHDQLGIWLRVWLQRFGKLRIMICGDLSSHVLAGLRQSSDQPHVSVYSSTDELTDSSEWLELLALKEQTPVRDHDTHVVFLKASHSLGFKRLVDILIN